MNEPRTTLHLDEQARTPSERLGLEIGLLAGRLAELLRNRFVNDPSPVASALEFLDHAFHSVSADRSLREWSGNALERQVDGQWHPIERLAYGFALSPFEVDLLLLAGLAEEHEGYADIFRTLHPLARPRPTTGLAAQLFSRTAQERFALRDLLEAGSCMSSGVLRLEGDGPLFTRDLILAEQLWSVLHGIDAWPSAIIRSDTPAAMHGLDEWLRQPSVVKAQRALQQGRGCSIIVSADDEETAFQRAGALVHAANVKAVRIMLPAEPNPELEGLIQVHAMARGAVPILRVPHGDGPQRTAPVEFARYPGPVVICTRGGVGESSLRPLISITSERLSSTALREMWSKTLPDMTEHATTLAARYPVEPSHALKIVSDLELNADNEASPPQLDDVASCIRARATSNLSGGVQLVRPVAGWPQLVLPQAQLSQLSEAVDRLYLQSKVLDDWRFLQGRRGSRGVRMLFSGPPGTGKTLSAEVLANSLNVDLLLVDLSRVVSKWIGETEKNLAEVFETAERAKAVLLFDEADALFGKRSEISDAHDRYANLETAYLLSRLERFDGLTILSTNLRQNIDAAFTRRLEFIVEFEEPVRAQRLALWQCHLPEGVPIADDVSLEELAAQFPIVGGLIRNAAVAAAFLAAGEGVPIARDHFIRAVRREYEKAGKAYRDLTTVVSRH